MATARLHSRWVGGRCGYVYSVVHDGKLLVERARDPEFDAARALLAKGITGSLTMLDGKTGIPRTIIDIEPAAKLCTVERQRDGLRFERYAGAPVTKPAAPEDEVAVGMTAPTHMSGNFLPAHGLRARGCDGRPPTYRCAAAWRQLFNRAGTAPAASSVLRRVSFPWCAAGGPHFSQ